MTTQAQRDELSPRSQMKRDQIVRAARQLFIEQGYGATSMEAIRLAAGVSKPTLYNHFEDKGALFAAVLGTLIESVGGDWLAAIEADAIPLLNRDELRNALLMIAHRVVNGFMRPEYLGLLRVIVTEMGRFPDLGTVFRINGPERGLRDVATLLSRAHELGHIKIADAELGARLFMGPFLTFALLNGLLEAGDPKPPSAERITLLVDMFMQMT